MPKPRTPNALKKAAGTYRKDRDLPGIEAEPDPNVPTPPPHLTRGAKREWKRLVGEMAKLGLVTNLDRASLASYCLYYDRHVEAEKQIAETGTIIKSPSGYPIQSPFVAISNKAAELMRQFGSDIGLSPAARTKARVQPPKPEKAKAEESGPPQMRIAN